MVARSSEPRSGNMQTPRIWRASWLHTGSRFPVAIAVFPAATIVFLLGLGAGSWIGCSGATEVNRASVAELQVDPAGASISGVDSTYTFSVRALDSSGNLIPSPAVTWSSLNANVATMEAGTGKATAVASGQVTISAELDGLVSYGLLTVAVPGEAPVSRWIESRLTSETLEAVWGTSPTNIYAVGSLGIILHYDGSRWNTMPSGVNEILRGVWGASPNDVYTVGSQGSILHYDGVGWRGVDYPGSSESLYDVWGSSPNDVFVVGDGGTILHYDGTSWTTMRFTGIARLLTSVWGVSPTDVSAVASNGTIYQYDGKFWNKSSDGVGEPLKAVWCPSADDWYAAGAAGTVLYMAGATRYRIGWTAMSRVTDEFLFDLSGTSSDNVYAVGDSGTILHYDGDTWSQLVSGTTNWLFGVWATSSGTVLAVGREGTVLLGQN